MQSEPQLQSSMTQGVDAAAARRTDTGTPAESADRGLCWPGALCLLVATLIAYSPVFKAGFIWDDDAVLTANPVIKSVRGLFDIWFSTKSADYWPLTYTSFWLEWRVWGMDATGYHVTNVVLHGLSAVVMWRILRRLRIPGAWVAALLFAVHPVNVSSVAWITERKNTLSMFCLCVSLLCYLRFDQAAEVASARTTGNPSRLSKWYWVSFVMFALALLSKASVVMLPFVLLACAWWQRGKITKQDFRQSAPFFAASLALGLITIWFQYQRAIGQEVVNSAGFFGRLATAGRAVWFYLFKDFVPLDLSFVYPRWEIDASSPIAYLPGLAFVAVLFAAWRSRRSWGRSVLFGLGYFVLMLLPALGFLNIYFQKYSLVADHWQYFALPGVIALFVGGAALCFPMGPSRIAGRVVVVAIATVLAVLTWRQSTIYHDSETLWLDTLAKNPKAWIAHTNLGVDMAEKGQVEESISRYRQALALKPDDAYTLNNMGSTLANQGKLQEAIEYYKRAHDSMPSHAESLNNMANALYALGRTDEAMQLYARVVEIDPGFVDTQLVVASALISKGNLSDAIVHYEAVLKADPNNAQAHFEIANALGTTGKTEDALAHYREALRIRPDYPEALNNMGVFLGGVGRVDEAIVNYRRAVEVHADYLDALINLGGALAHQGRTDEALTYYRRAAKAAPRDVKALASLASALATFGKLDEAIATYRDLLGVQPGEAGARVGLGQLLVMQGKMDEALALYGEGLRSDPSSMPLRLATADVLLQTGQLDQAMTQYRQILTASPESVEAHLGLGFVLMRQGLAEEASTHFNEAVRLAPTNESAHVSLVQALRTQGKVAEALGHAQQVLRANPDSIAMLNDTAWVLATFPDEKARNPRESLKLSKHALDLTQARDPQVLDTVAAGFAALGDFTQAVAAATKAIEVANAAGRKDIVPEIQSRLALYQAQKPFIDSPSNASTAPPPK